MAVKHQGQGEPCKCGHHRLYHGSYGPCMVLNCQCVEYEADPNVMFARNEQYCEIVARRIAKAEGQ